MIASQDIFQDSPVSVQYERLAVQNWPYIIPTPLCCALAQDRFPTKRFLMILNTGGLLHKAQVADCSYSTNLFFETILSTISTVFVVGLRSIISHITFAGTYLEVNGEMRCYLD